MANSEFPVADPAVAVGPTSRGEAQTGTQRSVSRYPSQLIIVSALVSITHAYLSRILQEELDLDLPGVPCDGEDDGVSR